MQEVAPGLGVWRILNVLDAAFSDQMAAALSCAWANVNNVVRVANRVFVVLNHHQRIAFVAQTFQGTQQDLVVPRVQSNGRLVKHITHPLQVAAQLGRQANPLGFATTQGGGSAVQGQVA